jgi:glycosyltransferase involved in cell wall biosynthesis
LAPSKAAAAPLRHANVPARVVKYGVSLPEVASRPGGTGRLVVGTVGTISRRKGSDLFLAAARRVCQEVTDVEFRMIGGCASGPERTWAEALVDSARRSGVRSGTRADIFSELAEWDLFVLPSREDAFPLAVLEAMATGLPVIGTRVGGMPEQVTPETGILVDADDVEALAGAILKLARQPERRAAMGAAARRRVESDLTSERQAEHLHEAYLATLAACAERSS